MKPRREIKVGDKIEWVDGYETRVGRVTKLSDRDLGETMLAVYEDKEGTNRAIGVHRRQIVKVIRKKKKEKREPRVVYLREQDGLLLAGYNTRPVGGIGIRCVEFREVLKDE